MAKVMNFKKGNGKFIKNIEDKKKKRLALTLFSTILNVMK